MKSSTLTRRHLLARGATLGLATLLGAGLYGCSQNASTTTTADAGNAAMVGANGAMADTSASAEKPGTIAIGFWPVASALPFFVAQEKGYFKKAGLDVTGTKFSSPQQVSQELIAGRLQGAANGTATGALVLAEIAQPDLLKVIATNVSDGKYVLDEVITKADSPATNMSYFKGKKIVFGCGPGPQNKATAEAILAGNGITDARIQEVDIKQHVAAVASGQLDAAYTLEPTGTIGADKKLTKVIDTGVTAKYIVGGGAGAQSHGGAAALTTEFIKKYPQTTKKFLTAYAEAIEDIRKDPDGARAYLPKYTPIADNIAKKVPLIPYVMYSEMKPADVENLQKFLNFMTTKKVFAKKVDAASLIYKPA